LKESVKIQNLEKEPINIKLSGKKRRREFNNTESKTKTAQKRQKVTMEIEIS
jgi:hypothetical protein